MGLAPHPAARVRNPRRGLWLVSAYYFLQKATVNVLFISSQTVFFQAAGVWGLPYVYTALNVVFIALQAALVQRLKAHSAVYLSLASWLFAALLCARVAAGASGGPAGATLFLMAVMVYDLFFNQFFVHYLNEIFPLQEGKLNLPVVTAAGSFAFILSGLALKLSLSFVGLAGVTTAALALFLACIALFAAVRREYAASESLPPAAPGPGDVTTPEPGDGETGPRSDIGELGRLLVAAGFLGMAGKYWLDYQYSRAITQAFPGERELASFIAVYTSVTDLLVLGVQMTVAGRVLSRLSLAASLALMPAAVLAGSGVTLAIGSPMAVLATQFLFTLLSKTVHNSASALILPVLPRAVRLRAMSLAGMASSAGCLLVGLALIAVQSRLTTAAAFGVALVLFGALLAVISRMGQATSRALVEALDAASFARRHEALDSLGLLDPAERERQVGKLLLASQESERDRGLEACRQLGASARVRLLAGFVEREADPRRLAVAARLLGEGAPGEGLHRKVREMLADETLDARVRANLLEAVGGSSEAIGALGLAAGLVDHPHHRVAAAACGLLLRVATRREWLERALGRLAGMLRERGSPHARSAALVTLGESRNEVFLPELAAALGDGDATVTGHALSAVARLDDPAVAPALRRFLETGPEPALAATAERHLARVSKLAIHSVRQLLDALTEAERLQAAGYVTRTQDDAKARLFLKALAWPEPGLRRALCELVDECDEPGWLTLLERSAAKSADGSPLAVGELASELTTGAWMEMSGWASLCSKLLRHGRRAEAEQLLTAALGRLWVERACLERSEAEGIEPVWIERARRRWEERTETALGVATLACARPASALEAIGRLAGKDRFAASLAQEYLASELPRGVHELLVPLARGAIDGGFVQAAGRFLDVTRLSAARSMALLGPSLHTEGKDLDS